MVIRASLVIWSLIIILITVSPHAQAQNGGPARDRSALIALYNATDGPNWKNNGRWLTEAELNDWHGVELDRSGRVSKLNLRINGLNGEIPSQIGDLSSLEALILEGNELNGHIPTELGNLAILSELNLGWNQLSGEIPVQLSKLSWLQTLDLSSNLLSGKIPPDLGNLTQLKALILSDNQLTGEIPSELGGIVSLQRLWLGINRLSGEIPPELGSLRELGSLSLFDNNLSGRIPAELGGLSNLDTLILDHNQLTGEIPSGLGNLTKLENLYLAHNQLTGEIPAELGGLNNLASLELQENLLSGQIPPELGKLSMLEALFLGFNQLSGTIPPELAELSQLQSLSIGDNLLSGEIPRELSNIANLQNLNLSHNRLIGEIPRELGNMANLQNLNLSHNGLIGEIPSELGNLSMLEDLLLGNNQLNGEIPPQLSNLSDLYELSLNSNRLSGEIPPELGSLSRLGFLNLAGNQLSGTIPPEIGELRNVYRLNLSGNQLSGSLPPEMGNLRELSYLVVDNNQLSGQLPLELSALNQLERLFVAENPLTGCIPIRERRIRSNDFDALGLPYCEDQEEAYSCSTGWAIRELGSNPGLVADCEALLASRDALAGTGHLNWWADIPMTTWAGVTIGGVPERVTEIVLEEKGLTGTVPPELGLLLKLERLRLGHNRLTGEIPPDLGNLVSLKELELSSNELTGPVPIELASLPSLEKLILYLNHLGGEIPSELGEVSTLRQLSLRGNQLTGEIPPELGNLSRLKWLQLSRNQLTGEIPAELGMLTNLEFLILESNNLSGEIPPELGNLSKLKTLILSENQLTGEIFAEVGSLESLEQLELDGNQLRGSIPSQLGGLRNLKLLKLYENLFTGCFPISLSAKPDLYYVHDGLPICPRPVPVVQEGGTISIDVSELFLKPEIALLATGTARISNAVNGVAQLDEMTIVYQHDGSETVQGGFDYVVQVDNESTTFDIQVKVIPINDLPEPGMDRVSVVEGGFVLIPVSSLLINDFDPDSENLTISGVGEAQDGTTSLKDNVIVYEHDGSDRRSSSFTYILTDGIDTSPGLVLVDVTNVNDRPSAVGDNLEVDEGDTLLIDASHLLKNDIDPDGDPLTVTGTVKGAKGGVALSDGVITYTHDGSETTGDSFSYTISDGIELATGVVTITVRPINDPPVARKDATMVNEGKTLKMEAAALLANDTDVEEDVLSVAAVGEAINGTVYFDGTAIIFAHDGSESENASFTYAISDGTDVDATTVDVSVSPVNDPPEAEGDVAAIDEGAELSLEAALFMANDTDAEGDLLNIVAVKEAVNGTVLLDGTTIVFSHDGSETTTGSFFYTLSDGSAEVSAQVELNVAPVNDPPISATDRVAVDEGASVQLEVSTLLQNDSDPDSETLTITGVGDAFNGSVRLDGTTVVYEHDGSETLKGGFTYTVSDGVLTSRGKVQVDVTPVRDFPTIIVMILAIAIGIAMLTVFYVIRNRRNKRTTKMVA